ncbi:MAG: lipid-A-disaccharide synthase [Candidatus Eiseniibacteriota bacterium]|nr:MAG: lipid-A-disaccharide synthase [Candidatus Eisenbacteria bacterium]
MNRRKVLVVAGEPSGDLHASRLVRALRDKAPDLEVLGVGGPRMREAGTTMVVSLEHMGVMGFTEVISKLHSFIGLMWKLKKLMKHERPQLLIAVDFPGFNLRLCRYAKRLGIPVMYYIAPQVWAWGQGRVKFMASNIDRIAVVFPFEVDFFRGHGLEVEFVGHPLLESVRVEGEKAEVRRRLGLSSELPVVALLPGSRRQEVRRLLPSMLAAGVKLSEKRSVELAVCAADGALSSEIKKMIAKLDLPVRVLEGRSSELLYVSSAAVIASGSATLEAAILGTPMVIVYRVSPLSWAIARRLVAIDTIGLVNIVAGKKIVSEYLQNDIDPSRISEELGELVFDEEKRRELIASLALVESSLGRPGASQRAAALALSMLPAVGS